MKRYIIGDRIRNATIVQELDIQSVALQIETY